MTPSWRGLALTAFVALAAGFGGVWLGKQVFQHRGPPALHEVVHDRLHLRPDQRARIETLEANFLARRRTLELEMQTANAELADAIRREHGYGPRVTAAVERFHGAMRELQSETIRHVFAMREVLDAEQQAAFDATIVEALTAEAR
jgi:hypothetical protein